MDSAAAKRNAGQELDRQSGLDLWFRARRRSWAARYRGQLSFCWVLLAVIALSGLASPMYELLFVHGVRVPNWQLENLRSLLFDLAGFSLLVLYFQLCGSCISYCLPGSDMLGGLSVREFHLGLRRNCLAITYRLALQLVLPAMLVNSVSSSLILLKINRFDGLALLSDSLQWMLLAMLHAVLAAQLSLRLPGMAILFRTVLSLFGIVLCFMLASAPLFVAYILTDNFSDLSTWQSEQIVSYVPPFMMGLILYGLLAWTRVPPPDMIEELDRHNAARRV